MTDYIERSTVVAMLDAAQAEQSQAADEEDEKAAGNMAASSACRYTARVLVGLADAVRELPAVPVKERRRKSNA